MSDKEWFDKIEELKLFKNLKTDTKEKLLQNYLKENIAKILFYSSQLEGNPIKEKVGLMLINSKLMYDNVKLESYIELLNFNEVTEYLIRLSNKKIKPNDIIELRKKLLYGILIKYVYGFRRIRNRAGYFVSEPVNKLPKILEKSIKIINTKPKSTKNAFINAFDFHLNFAKLHPFEDGVGRTTRLLMNLYLLKSSIRPIEVTKYNSKLYNFTLSVYDITKMKAPFVILMLAIRMTDNERESVINSISNEDMMSVAIKNLIKVYKNPSDRKILNDVELLYNYGLKENNKELIIMTLCILGLSKIKSDITIKALISKDPKFRALGLLAAEMSKLNDKEKELAKNMALQDTKINRMIAIQVVIKAGLADIEFLNKEINNTDEEVILIAALQGFKGNKLELPEKINEILSSEYITVKMRGYCLLAEKSDTQYLIKNVINKLPELGEVITDYVIDALHNSNRLNDKKIANAMSKQAIKNKRVKRVLLGYLAFEESISEQYIEVIKSSLNKDPEENAYGVYLLNKIDGHKPVKNIIKPEPSDDKLLKLVRFLSYVEYLKTVRKKNISDICLDLNNSKLFFIKNTKINIQINENSFGKYFLSLYNEYLKHWK